MRAKGARAIARFGNAGCSYYNPDDVPLSSEDKKLVERKRLHI